jgi:hypothetical protein
MRELAILVPGLVLGIYTMLFFFYMGMNRRGAVASGQIAIKYYRTYDQGQEPERLRVLTRHSANLLETPTLFYAGLLFAHASGAVSPFFLIAAWLYVAARFAHSFVHLGSNNVLHRFFAFATSLVILLIFWIGVLVHTVGALA